MNDIALVVDGVVTQVWRATTLESVAESLPAGEHDLYAFEAGAVVCGMIWDGETLAAPEIVAPSARRLIPKSVVQERLNDLGRLADALAILNDDPLRFGRWFAPNHPNVYFDDEGLLTVLGPDGLDLTEEQIAAVTA